MLKSVSVSGIALVGEALTASTTPAGAAVVYQWQKSDSENGTYTDIVGATGNTYVLDDGDAGKWIRVKATGTGYYTGTAISEPHKINGWVIAVSVSGIAKEGETLTAEVTPPTATVTYQWQRSDSQNGTYEDINGETGKTYALSDEDAGKWIRVRVTGVGNYTGALVSDPFGLIKSLNETALAMSAPDIGIAKDEDFIIPVKVQGNIAIEDRKNMVRFYAVISGLDAGDIELKALPDGGTQEIVTNEAERGHAGADAGDLVIAWGPAGGTQLNSIDITGSTAAASFAAAIKRTGNYTVTFTAYDITAQKRLNGANENVSITVGANLQGLTIEGSAIVGNTLTAAGIEPADFPVTYQWQRSSGKSSYADISGATGETYTLTDDDIGRRIRVTVSYGTKSKTCETVDLAAKGDGSASDPYIVATAEQLDKLLRKNPDKHYKQINDIDLGEYDNWEPLPAFGGVFDGNGHTISSLKVTRVNRIGLFSELARGELRNINLDNVVINGARYVGGLVGVNNGIIESSWANCTVSGLDITGGLVGENKGIIKQCFATGNVSAGGSSGGLVGTNSGTIEKSWSNCSVSGSQLCGGLVGENTGIIKQCFATGDVTGDRTGFGGLVGISDSGTIENSYARGSVSARTNVGGLVGQALDTEIKYCYATGKVTATLPEGRKAGLVGTVDLSIRYSYYDTITTGQSDNNGYPRTTEQMKKGTANGNIGGKAIYTDWSTDIWDFGGDDDYPVLKGLPEMQSD